MKDKKIFSALAIFIFLAAFAYTEPLESPSWGFKIDLPEAYEFSGGDGRNQFSFENPLGAKFDLRVYQEAGSLEDLAGEVQAQLKNSGELDPFSYRGKNTCLMELAFMLPGTGQVAGWALFIELSQSNLASPGNSHPAGNPRESPPGTQGKPILLAMAYSPVQRGDLSDLHLSALDSIAPEEGDRLAPGPITAYAWPGEKRAKTKVFGLDIEALLFDEDAEAAQALVDREFQVLRRYENAPNWQQAWIRFYRAIYRDSFERLTDLAFQVERKLNIIPASASDANLLLRENRDFANQVLKWVQSFEYERDFLGSDFVNAVTAATEGRGDCDSRALLWAIILKHANIPAAMMVSRQYSHAMGLADLPGGGARFEVESQRLLVAETTANVDIGLIGETVSDIEYWLGILFE